MCATDLTQTAIAILETLKSVLSESDAPATSDSMSLLMSDETCYSPFINAIANVFKPEVLTTLPLQVALVEKYDKILQSSLGMRAADRLDTLIHSIFEMNKFIQVNFYCLVVPSSATFLGRVTDGGQFYSPPIWPAQVCHQGSTNCP